MFKSRFLPVATFCLGLALLISSFDWSGKTAEDEVEAEIPGAIPGAIPAVAVEASPTPPPVATQQKTRLPRQGLRVGDRFPLVKTVEQRVTQQQEGGDVTTSSRLAVTLFLEVSDVVSAETAGFASHNRNPGDTQLTVRYTRVQFEQDLPGEAVDYDSDNPPSSIPQQARAYHALVGNGFSFWMDRRQQIRELVGFQDFVRSCLRDSTPQQRTQVWKSLTGKSSSDQIANFIDGSIGLLPPTAKKINHRWQQTRRVMQPVPVDLAFQYTLREIGETTALINIGGTAVPAAAVGTDKVKVEIQGGSIRGQCTIDRRTGLPIQSRVEQVIEMTAHLGGGATFRQTKQTLTRINAINEELSEQNFSPTASAKKSTTR